MTKIVAVIGSSGDLGKQLVEVLGMHDLNVLAFDRSDRSMTDIIKAQADIIHLCVPTSALPEYSDLADGEKIVILHDSVMSTSESINQRYFNNHASIAHMLMNDHQTVVIAQDTPAYSDLYAHFSDLGMKPVSMPINKHDRIMAESQAPLALLVRSIHEPLNMYREQRLLTPSGEELVNALNTRAASWTDATIESLLRNPELHSLIHDMQNTLKKLDD